MFKKILIANRGEIAARLIRGCRDMGLPSVAVYSDADRTAPHVQLADEAYRLGAAAAGESYLNIERILAAARRAGADAVHPGYGFLAENAGFARACAQAGLTFIGPSPESMEALGEKTAARRLAQAQGVPILAGTVDPVRSREEAFAVAARVGYPVMLKAAAGGGGKGMRRVAEAADLAGSLELAGAEAKAAFGDGAVFIERALDRPRHIEIQILGDRHGRLIGLGERECSLQRRHQKIVEESPAPNLSDATRSAMTEAALAVARAAGYSNAGTVEFLVDAEEKFYFLEVNTRLQVEHPVTEAVTGLDLVELQLRVAAGEALPLTQADVERRGHAIECRVYAEDPARDFMPSPGTIRRLKEPQGPGVRVDSGVYEGWTVPLEYDPLLAKLIVAGADRTQALARLERALGEYRIGGIRHNLDFFRRLMQDAAFRAGHMDTGSVARLLASPEADAENRTAETAAAIAAAWVANTNGGATTGAGNHSGAAPEAESAWRRAARLGALRETGR